MKYWKKVKVTLLSRRFRYLRWCGLLLLFPVVVWHALVWCGSFPTEALTVEFRSSLVLSDSSGRRLRAEGSTKGGKHYHRQLSEISKHLVNATLVSEDREFYDHDGVDWTAMGRSVWLTLTSGRSYGGSTLSMQLVKVSVGHSRTVVGKAKQMVLAARLERQYSKEEILEHYLNRVYYGNGAWGAERAAQLYFRKSSRELSLGEAAALAVIPRGPTRYDPLKNQRRHETRRVYILKQMLDAGVIDVRAYDLAVRVPIRWFKQPEVFEAPHFSEFVKQRLPPDFSSARVKTTLDLSLQKDIEVAVTRHVNKMTARNLTQAAAVVIRNSDGAILAMVGSDDYSNEIKNGAYNGVTARLRPGSTLKPFVYATALEHGDTPATIARDVILPKDLHRFYSKDVKSHGFARYRESLAGSYNLSAVHTLQRVGLSPVLHKLREAGLHHTLTKADAEYDWGLAIGHAEVRLLDLTAAFSNFGRGGRAVVPRVVEQANAGAKEWKEEMQESSRVFSPEVAYQIFDILSDPDARKPMFGDRVPLNLPFKIALKTGTTKAYTDLWAVGVTKEYTVGVWGGNFDGSPTHQVKSVSGATPLLRSVYVAIASRFGEPTAPSVPASLMKKKICPMSGMAPGPHCTHEKEEWFNQDEQLQTCSWHGEEQIHYPPELISWVNASSRHPKVNRSYAGSLRIVMPRDGSRFALEPYRDRSLQKPILRAFPEVDGLVWKVNGVSVDQWIPRPGKHKVTVSNGTQTETSTIEYF